MAIRYIREFLNSSTFGRRWSYMSASPFTQSEHGTPVQEYLKSSHYEESMPILAFTRATDQGRSQSVPYQEWKGGGKTSPERERCQRVASESCGLTSLGGVSGGTKTVGFRPAPHSGEAQSKGEIQVSQAENGHVSPSNSPDSAQSKASGSHPWSPESPHPPAQQEEEEEGDLRHQELRDSQVGSNTLFYLTASVTDDSSNSSRESSTAGSPVLLRRYSNTDNIDAEAIPVLTNRTADLDHNEHHHLSEGTESTCTTSGIAKSFDSDCSFHTATAEVAPMVDPDARTPIGDFRSSSSPEMTAQSSGPAPNSGKYRCSDPSPTRVPRDHRVVLDRAPSLETGLATP